MPVFLQDDSTTFYISSRRLYYCLFSLQVTLQDMFLKSDSTSVGQESPSLYGTRRLITMFTKKPQIGLVLRKMNSIHN